MSTSLSTKARVIIWGRAASRCAFPGCPLELIEDETATDDPSLLGDIAHIVAESPDGPRGTSPMSREERNHHSNLMLLCKVHHKQVDDQPREYTVEKLHGFKARHEAWVRSSLERYDEALQRDKERYASFVEQWEERCGLDTWEAWSERLLSMDQPSLMVTDEGRLAELREWLFSRIWPKRLVDLEGAVENFRVVLSDLHETFLLHAERSGDVMWTRKFYQLDNEWNPKLYEALGAQYQYHVDLVQDLTLELTRAANLVCDEVRRGLDPAYRMDSGLITVIRGPDISLQATRLRPQYAAEGQVRRPYPGLALFEVERQNRDVCIGRGPATS